MNHTISIYTHLKNTDLHAVSAFEALVDMMHETTIKKIHRYQHWQLTLNLTPETTVDAAIAQILKRSYSIVNTNKETYTLNRIPELPSSPNTQCFRFEIKSKQNSKNEALAKALTLKTEVEITAITKTLIWEMVVQDDRPRDVVEKELLSRVVKTTSRTQGLLMNPLYEEVI